MWPKMEMEKKTKTQWREPKTGITMPAIEQWEAKGFGARMRLTTDPICPGRKDVLNNGLTELTAGAGHPNCQTHLAQMLTLPWTKGLWPIRSAEPQL